MQYEEKDVSIDATARDEMIAKSNQMGVPVIDVDGQLTVGFDKERLSQLLNQSSPLFRKPEASSSNT